MVERIVSHTVLFLSWYPPDTVLQYIASLQSTPSAADASASTASASAASVVDHPHYDPSSGREDYEQASTYKQEAAEAKDRGDYETALKLYNQAIVAAPPSALLYATRASVLEQLGHDSEAMEDCTYALEQNPDSAKAYKIRGKLRYRQSQGKEWESALSDLNQAQAIDFDPELVELLKELTQRRVEDEHVQAQARMEQEDALRKKAQEIKQARAEAAAAASASRNSSSTSRGGGGGFPTGMDPSMMMSGLMSDPEVQEAMKNPKVLQALQELMSGPGGPMGLMSNPGKLQQLMMDPDVGPVLQKLMGKFMGGGGGGMGGMGGMPDFGGSGSGAHGGGDDDEDLGDIPDLDEMD